MKKMAKKIIAVVLAAVMMVLAFAACSGNTDGQKEGESKSDLKIGVIHIGDPKEGAGYSYAHDQGIKKACEALGIADSQVIRKNNVADNNKEAAESAIDELVEEGCKVIFATSYGYMDAVENRAAKYPEVYFSHCSGYKSNETNFNNYFGRIYEARYLAGIAAGMKTQSNKIGYVAAQNDKNPEVTGGIDAFALGVKSVNPDAKVYVKVTNTWFDLTVEKDAAVSLLNEGCDVIAQHQDTAQPQIAAQEAGKWGVGYNSDMAIQAPKAVLTSVIWNWEVYYQKAIESVLNGKWDSSNYFGTMKEGLVDVTPVTENCADGTKEAIEAAKKKIVEEDFRVFSGEIKDNKGNVQVKAGEHLEDDYIAGKINWYVDNVVVK